MSHSGTGGHGGQSGSSGHHGLHHHHIGHHSGHGHGIGGGGQIVNMVFLLGLSHSLCVALFGDQKVFSKIKEGYDNMLGKEPGQNASIWQKSFKPETLLDKLIYMDLRPLVLLILFIGVIATWLSTVYWLRHHDDRTGITFQSFDIRTRLLSDGKAATSPVPLSGASDTRSNTNSEAATIAPGGGSASTQEQAMSHTVDQLHAESMTAPSTFCQLRESGDLRPSYASVAFGHPLPASASVVHGPTSFKSFPTCAQYRGHLGVSVPIFRLRTLINR